MYKLCFVISSLRSGGAERVVATLANSFIQNEKFKVSIITVNEALPFYKLSENIELISLNVLNDKISIVNTKNRIVKLIKAFKKVKPSVIISFNAVTSCEAIIAARYSKVPIIISERANPKTSANSFYWRALRRFTFPLSNHLVCQTKASLAYYSWMKNKSVIHNPVVIPDVGVMSKEKIVLGVGSLIHIKGFDLLIDAFVRVLNSSKDKSWKLMILGEGSERQNLEKKIRNSNYEDNILLPGKVTNISYYYSISSIFVLSSRSEGMPNVLLEAMSFGIPSLAFDCEYGPSEILENEKFGLLAENGNVEDLSRKLKLLIDDALLRRDLVNKAIFRSRDYTIERVTESWLEVINKI